MQITIELDEELVKAGALILRAVADALDRAVLPPPIDPPPVEPPPEDPPVEPPPVEPPIDPWLRGTPDAAGWYETLAASDSEDAASPLYWDGTQWLWSPDWFAAPASVADRYRPVTPPTSVLVGISR